jgi:hypothetical protein
MSCLRLEVGKASRSRLRGQFDGALISLKRCRVHFGCKEQRQWEVVARPLGTFRLYRATTASRMLRLLPGLVTTSAGSREGGFG